MKPITWRAETRAIADLAAYDRNPRQFTKKGMSDLTKSIERFGLAEPIVINTDGTVIGGHARLEVLRARGDVEVAVYVPDRKLTAKQLEELCVRLNANTAGAWDFDILANAFDVVDLSEWGLDIPGVDVDAFGEDNAPQGTLAERFLVPPFSVLNAREGWWQDRKRAWLALGIKSELGRGGG